MINFTVYFNDGTQRVLHSTKLQAVANYLNLKFRNRGAIKYMVADGYTYTMEDINSIAVSYRKQMNS